MRVVLGQIVVASMVAGLLGYMAPAGEERADDLVRQAIAAAGGSDILAKYPAGRVVGQGTMTLGTQETSFTFEQAHQVPGRFRTVVRCEVKGHKWELLQVVNDGVAKQIVNGRAAPLTEAGTKELQMAALLNEIGQLSPLMTERKFVCKTDKQVKGPDSAGLLIQVRGHPEIHCVFDRKTGHLIRISYKGTDPETAKEAELETTFDDFKAVSGLIRPTHTLVTRDGKKILDVQIEKFLPLEKIDSKAFILEE